MRFSDRWPDDILKLWKKKALEIFSKYPQLDAIGITGEDSPFWLQIYDIKVLFQKHRDRILGTFETPEKAEAFLDTLRKPKP
jgi:hypothetical protein